MATFFGGVLEGRPVRPAVPLDMLPVIHPGVFEFFVVKLEAERLDEVQFCAGGRAEPRHVARVGRDFRFNQDDVHVGKLQVQSLKLKKTLKANLNWFVIWSLLLETSLEL